MGRPKSKSTKRKAKPKNASRLKSLITNRYFLLVLVVILLGLYGGMKVRHSVLANREKQQFETADHDMGQLYDAIIAELGEPVDHYHEKSCEYTNLKYSKGILGCDINYVAVYAVSNNNEATTIRERASTVTQHQPKLFSFIRLQKNNFSDREDQGYFDPIEALHPSDVHNITEQGINTPTAFPCAVGYLYFNTNRPLTDYRSIVSNSTQSLIIEVGCGKAAIAEHYPVKE